MLCSLDGHRTLFVNDQRKFGRIRVVTTADLAEDLVLTHLGPEPLSQGLTAAVLDDTAGSTPICAHQGGSAG